MPVLIWKLIGKRGALSTGGQPIEEEINDLLRVLNLSDGEHSLLDIADWSSLPFEMISDAAETLRENGLLAGVSEREGFEAVAGKIAEVTSSG